MQRTRDRVDVAATDGAEEVRLGLDRRGPARLDRQVEEGAEAAEGVGETHQRAAVEHAAGRALVLAPGEPSPHLARRRRHDLDSEIPRERRRGGDLGGQLLIGRVHAREATLPA
jgi:hypothetical protein